MKQIFLVLFFVITTVVFYFFVVPTSPWEGIDATRDIIAKALHAGIYGMFLTFIAALALAYKPVRSTRASKLISRF